MINRIMLGLFCSVLLVGCNSEGDGDPESGDSLTLDANTAESMAGYTQLGLGVRAIAVDTTLNVAGAPSATKGGLSAKGSIRNLETCYTESYDGDSTSGTATLTYTSCSFAGLNFDSQMTIKWTDNGSVKKFEVSGNYDMSISDSESGTNISISFDPMNFSIEDNESTSSTEMDFKFNFDDGTSKGYLAMETTDPLVTDSDDYDTITSGAIKMNDGQGSSFLITFNGTEDPLVTSL